MFLVEGPQATREALTHRSHHVVDLFLTPASAERHSDVVELASRAGIEITLASEDVLTSMCDTVTPQGVLLVCDFVDVTLAEVVAANPTNVAVLHQVQDPGNVGNIIRSADAAGAGAVIVTAQSVDVFNPKVVRATTGSPFFISPVVTGVDLVDALAHLHQAGLTVYATEAGGRVLISWRPQEH